MIPYRDTILVIGPSASGKTATLNYIRQYAELNGIHHEFTVLSDAQTIVEHMLLDDKNGAENHTHPWCVQGKGHTHDTGGDRFPFAVTGNRIIHGMMYDFFTRLAEQPYTEQLRYAEWSGGKNVNPPENPASATDVSFETMARKLRSGELPVQGLLRVAAVIHPWTDPAIRLSLNEQRDNPTPEQIKFGTASWRLDMTAMKIFGEDDFDALRPLLEASGIPAILTVENTGDEQFLLALEGHCAKLFREMPVTKEGQCFGGKERK
jgi:hypothetical protein